MPTTRIPELSGIEFSGHKSVQDYAKKLRALFRDLGAELEFSAEDLYTVLRLQKGHPLLMGVDVKIRARRVVKRLERCQELTAGGAIEAVRFYAEFRTQFAEVIHPSPAKKAPDFDFDDA